MRSPVYKAFDATRTFRVAVSPPSGRFKLEEARSELRRIRSDVDMILRIVCNDDVEAGKAIYDATPCAPLAFNYKGGWLLMASFVLDLNGYFFVLTFDEVIMTQLKVQSGIR